jgi:hypothetical protein
MQQSETPAPAPHSVLHSAVHSVAEVRTPLAARYLTQLCKHFEHRCAVTHDAESGDIAFAAGHCFLRAEPDVLRLSLEAADVPSLTQLQDVVARHLVRFAFREEMQVDWHIV